MPKLTRKKISVTDGRTDPNYRKASLLKSIEMDQTEFYLTVHVLNVPILYLY